MACLALGAGWSKRAHRTHAPVAALYARGEGRSARPSKGVQAEDRSGRHRLRQLAGTLSRWPRCSAGGPARRCPSVDRAHARPVRASDGTPLSASRGSTSPSQPAAASPALASSPTPALAGIFMAPRISEVDVSMPPDSRGWKRDALARTPPSAPAPDGAPAPRGVTEEDLAGRAPCRPHSPPLSRRRPAGRRPAAPHRLLRALWFDSPSMAHNAPV